MPKVICKDVQVGDKLYFWPEEPEHHYLCTRATYGSSIVTLTMKDSRSKSTYTTAYSITDSWGNVFRYEPAVKKSKEELVLEKIKYLDQRWKDRKCATNIGF